MVTRYAKFQETTHRLNRKGLKALRGVTGHFEKALIFKALAQSLRAGAFVDREHLYKHGYTGLENSQRLSAVIEALIQELYSAVDSARQVIRVIYGATCQGFPDSTRRTFQNAESGTLTGLPNELLLAFADAPWYRPLLYLRDELTHHDVGMCRANDENTISYSHSGILQNGEPLEIPDIFSRIEYFETSVNRFLGNVFHYLYSQLDQAPSWQMCGIFGGRVYYRFVAPLIDLTVHSGVCGTRQYDARCLFAESCGAYARAEALDVGPQIQLP